MAVVVHAGLRVPQTPGRVAVVLRWCLAFSTQTISEQLRQLLSVRVGLAGQRSEQITLMATTEPLEERPHSDRF